MGVFDHFPYTNLHELNLDWIMKAMKELEHTMNNFIAGNKLIFADPLLHDMSKSYAKNTVVIDDEGTAFVSLQAVPVGIPTSNSDYWLAVFDFVKYIAKIEKNFTEHYYRNEYRAREAYSIGDWIVLNDVLYKASAAIAYDDLFEIGTNIEHFTIEDFLSDFITSATALINQYKIDIDNSELLYRQQLAGDIAQTTESLQAQLDAAISGVTVDSEVINARVTYDGVTEATLGDAIRNQVTDIHKNLVNDLPALTAPIYDSTLGLFDFGNLGYFLDPYNTKTANPTWGYTSEYIEVEPNTKYYIPSRETAIINEYTSAKAHITGYSADALFTTSATAAYIRVSADVTTWNKMYFVKLPFTNNVIKNHTASLRTLGALKSNATIPLPDFDNRGYYLDATGTPQASADWGYTSTFIPIPSNSTIYFNTGGGTVRVNLYDANLNHNISTSVTDYDYFNSGSNAYMRLSASYEYWAYIDASYNYVAERQIRTSISVGADREYTRLRDAVQHALEIGNCDVYVYAGTYDLNTEFATEIATAAASDCGMMLGNNMHLIFMPGSKVVASFANNDTWANTWFTPFRSMASTWDRYGYTIEGLVLECQNTHYCIHDERSSIGKYVNKFINCKMSISIANGLAYYSCIGGGLGDKGRICIEECDMTSIYDGGTNVPAIGYHNGSGSTCESNIYITGCLLNGQNYIDISYHGTSTLKTHVYVNNCQMGGSIVYGPQTPTSPEDNMIIHDWNNVIV